MGERMTDIHKEIREAWGNCGRHDHKLEYRFMDWAWHESVWNPTWMDNMDYRIINADGEVIIQSNGKQLIPIQGIDTLPRTNCLTDTDYADGCCKAALARLMKPNREPEDIRKALAWLTLAVGGQQ